MSSSHGSVVQPLPAELKILEKSTFSQSMAAKCTLRTIFNGFVDKNDPLKFEASENEFVHKQSFFLKHGLERLQQFVQLTFHKEAVTSNAMEKGMLSRYFKIGETSAPKGKTALHEEKYTHPSLT